MNNQTVTPLSILRIPAFVGGAILLFALSAPAADRTWENIAETDFNAHGSWVGDVAPGTGDRALFDAVATTNPNLSSSSTIQGLIFGQIDVTASCC